MLAAAIATPCAGEELGGVVSGMPVAGSISTRSSEPDSPGR